MNFFYLKRDSLKLNRTLWFLKERVLLPHWKFVLKLCTEYDMVWLCLIIIHISQARSSLFLIGRLHLPNRGRGFEPITILLGWKFWIRFLHKIWHSDFFRSSFCTRLDIGQMRGHLPHSEPNVTIRFLHKNWYSEFLNALFAQESMLWFCACLEYSVTCFLASLKYIYI